MEFCLKYGLLLVLIIGITNAIHAEQEEEASSNWRPVVLMHGLLASAEAMSHAQKWIEADYPGIYIKNVEIGNGRDDSLLMDINKQVDVFAKEVASDPKLKNGFNLIGHSQGALISRAFIERYNYPPVYNFASWAGPQDGVYGVPGLNTLCPDYICPWLNWIMDAILDGAWVEKAFQEKVSFAAYWKDPFNLDQFKTHNIFLADIDNARDEKNSTYKKNLSSLNFMLLEYALQEEIVVPKQSPWFYFFAENSDSTIVPLNQSKIYTEDWIGLKTLDEQGKLSLVAADCTHQNLPRDVCKHWYDLYTKPLLNNTISV